MKTIAIAAALSLAALTASAETVRVSRVMCMDMATTAENISLDFEAGAKKEEVEAQWLTHPYFLKKQLHRASVPVLKSIINDLYSGTMTIEAPRMFDEVYGMCKEQIGNYVTFEDFPR